MSSLEDKWHTKEVSGLTPTLEYMSWLHSVHVIWPERLRRKSKIFKHVTDVKLFSDDSEISMKTFWF